MVKPGPVDDPLHEDAFSTQSTAPATAFLEDEELTHKTDDTHGREGHFSHDGSDEDDHTTTAEETKEEEFFRGMGDLNIRSPGKANRSESILKVTSSEMYVSEKRFSWKQLPKPDLAHIRSCSLLVTKRERTAAMEKKNVKFDCIHFRNYSQTLGDNPSCSYGPPISLDWKYEEGGQIGLEEYEATRGARRKLRQMLLNYYHRKNILQWKVGFTEEELKDAQKQAENIKRQRSLTRAMLPACKVEEVMQSMCRKAKRLGKSKSRWSAS
eukprot:CAMPEP_0198142398 /NCGR_PEP_ID=MMETSP1443-20131203/5193_1 /TAXON_ID=186043 /ORGANISM="Entomoneis sp., Strain CCMP2396" /LENGTH=267 /DNA_ID=CAMNT_0043805391 /DNA_START=81 /DNA_END=884 /DNA_ORIENTATION=+